MGLYPWKIAPSAVTLGKKLAQVGKWNGSRRRRSMTSKISLRSLACDFHTVFPVFPESDRGSQGHRRKTMTHYVWLPLSASCLCFKFVVWFLLLWFHSLIVLLFIQPPVFPDSPVLLLTVLMQKFHFYSLTNISEITPCGGGSGRQWGGDVNNCSAVLMSEALCVTLFGWNVPSKI